MDMIDEAKLLFQLAKDKTGLDKDLILSGCRKPHIIDVKRIIGVILRRHTKMKLWQIGEVLGGLDHSCIIHYLKTNQALMDTDYQFRDKFVFMERGFLSNRELVEVKLKMKLEEREMLNKEIAKLRKLVKIKSGLKSA
jgi:hypothetical protein